MAASEELGILGLDSLHYFVRKPERSDTFYRRGMGFQTTWRSSEAMVAQTGQRSTVYEAGQIRVVVSTPERDSCRAARYLRRHPAGIGSLTFQVESVERAWQFLERRGGTFIHGIRETRAGDGAFRHFSITTAIGDVAMRFVERVDFDGFAPGFERAPTAAETVYSTPFRFERIDHVTCNAPTMASVALWLEHVLGMEQCWDITFHTEDIRTGGDKGTGLRSVVMWDPRSGLKFPINEPLHPFFKEGQINRFVEDNWGAGVQHVALLVDDCVASVETLRERGIQFLETPSNYYRHAPERLLKNQVHTERLAHRLETLERLGILIDGSPVDQYLIQVFMKDAMTLYSEPEAGPFFYELIQRCGDRGFGGGNFRALFEAIEREQLGYDA